MSSCVRTARGFEGRLKMCPIHLRMYVAAPPTPSQTPVYSNQPLFPGTLSTTSSNLELIFLHQLISNRSDIGTASIQDHRFRFYNFKSVMLSDTLFASTAFFTSSSSAISNATLHTYLGTSTGSRLSQL